ncbi:MAG: hypothetical protein J6C44_00375 [Muribaculaceae bacterium]|nr:hypothetical protein [Muribaculaceae bacterium]
MDQWEWEDVPRAIRDEVKAEFGVNIDRALRKEPGRRSGDEQTAITRYMAELYRDEMPVNDKLIGNGNYPINDDGVPYDEYEDISVSLQGEQTPITDNNGNRQILDTDTKHHNDHNDSNTAREYHLNDEHIIRLEDGREIHATVADEADVDGNIGIYSEEPLKCRAKYALSLYREDAPRNSSIYRGLQYADAR